MIGSALASVCIPAYQKNYTKGREGHIIRKITVHHMAGRLTCERCGTIFQQVGREGSSHYGIGYDGRIAQYVSEEDTAWADGNWVSNLESVTIENADINSFAPWDVTDETFDALARLCADIAQRNGLGVLVKGKNLTWHSMYQPTVCPGEGLLRKMDLLCERANQILMKNTAATPLALSYQVYASRWLPAVSGYDTNSAQNGYAGILGKPFSGLYCSASAGNMFYRVHLKNGSWLCEVKNREDFAGILGKEIDGIMIRSDAGGIVYRVHTAEDGWLPAVSGYDEHDDEKGFAGVFGHAVDAVAMRGEVLASKAPESSALSSPDATGTTEKTEASALSFLKKWKTALEEFFA